MVHEHEIIEYNFKTSKLSKDDSILYIWYVFHLGALVFRNFGEFMNIVALPETPMMISMLRNIFGVTYPTARFRLDPLIQRFK